MNYYSTNNKSLKFSFRDAVMQGLAQDSGLFMPEIIPSLSLSFFKNLNKFSFQEIGFEIASKFIENEISNNDLTEIVHKTINFPAPLVSLSKSINVLELFHGPTLAFKDFGARFMAAVMSHFMKDADDKMNILVATSGDTGSAVANGFYDVEGINVFLLYPKNKVSEIQEKQLTTLDKNITALEIDGTFDDCQSLVKAAFVDKDIKSKMKLSSANSISIARLLPQIFYYFEGYKQLQNSNKDTVISVPSGNLGNLTGGLIAKKMGLPVFKFIAATNSNNVFTEYIESGNFIPRASQKTYSNAMDVGNPSNLARINDLFKNDISSIQDVIFSSSYSDQETLSGIKEVYNNFHYTIDPHGAVGYLALKDYLNKYTCDLNSIIVETAHPAKFKDCVELATGNEIQIPKVLADCIKKEKKAIPLKNEYPVLKEFLLSQK